MHRLLACSLLLVCGTVFAGSPYQLDLGASVEHGSLKVEPTVTGPAGKVLEYEMRVQREGSAGSSNSSQSGTVSLDRDGSARLASSSVSVTPRDRYRVTVRLLDKGQLVAQESQSFP